MISSAAKARHPEGCRAFVVSGTTSGRHYRPLLDYTAMAPEAECLDGPEKDVLAFALDRARAQSAWRTGGLDAEQLRRTHPPSTLTIAGLIKANLRHTGHVDLLREAIDGLVGNDPPRP